ncbi:MAG: TetR/AcrR family transcriptional regulator [Halieaceae bacterium]|nr:TetR/AcrR family transcriptional regulator [Halieaceae bacterium]
MTAPGRRSKSEQTRSALMRSAEQLFASKGVHNVTSRAIVEASGQKNESALQYHFGNREGLIREIHGYWATEIGRLRGGMLESLHNDASLRDIVEFMVTPPFALGRTNPDFRCYIRAFGPEVVLSELPAINAMLRERGAQEIPRLLQDRLPQLSSSALAARLDSAVRLASLSMAQHARQPNAFEGREAQLFLHRLMDSLVGLLGIEVSEETKKLENRCR